MNQPPRHLSVLHLTDYGAPYEGNFVASLRALEERLQAEGGEMTYVFPRRAGDTAWAREMALKKGTSTLSSGTVSLPIPARFAGF
jgi:hypothetical protein